MNEQFDLGERLGSMDAKLADAIKKIDDLAEVVGSSNTENRLSTVETKIGTINRFAWLIVGGLVSEFFAVIWFVGKKIWLLPK